MICSILRLKHVVLVLFFAVAQMAFISAFADDCPPELRMDGGSLGIDYKYVHAKVPASELSSVVNAIDDMGSYELETDYSPADPNFPKGVSLPKGIRCIVFTQLSRVSAKPVNGIDDIVLTVKGNCKSDGVSGEVPVLEVAMVETEIENLYKIKGLDIDPSWNMNAACGTGGVTGSN